MCILCFLFSLSALAQTEVLTNQTILQLQKAGLGKDLIKAKISNSQCNFDLSTDGMLALKKAGVADEVVTAMFTKANNAPAPATPTDALESGIYYHNLTTNTFDDVDGSLFTNSKAGGFGETLKRSVSGLFNAKNRVSLSGNAARLKITSTTPTFLFVFDKEKSMANFANSYFSSATSPNDFFLVSLTVGKNDREVVVGKYNNVSSDIGVDDAVKVSFNVKKLQKGTYEVTTANPLPAGEYCFMYSASSLGEGVTHKVFDFAIRP
jgi:hypothetical protein